MSTEKNLRHELVTSEFAQEVLDNVSPVYNNDAYNLIVFDAIGQQMDIILKHFRDMGTDIAPQNAPEWLLNHWADTYGVRTSGQRARYLDIIASKATYEDLEKLTWYELQYYAGTTEDIRRKVLAAINATNPITKSNFADFLEELAGYRVDLTHYPEDYYVTIHMRTGNGAAVLVEDLAEIVEGVIPAHVGFFISIENIRWIEFDSLNWTFQDLDDHEVTWEDFEKNEVWYEWLQELKD